MLKEAQAGISRWKRGLLRLVRTLHPDQLSVELKARRYRHRFCFEVLVARAEELVDRDPVSACRMAQEALSWVERNTPGEVEDRMCVLSLLGEALTQCRRVSQARVVFDEALALESAPIAELGALRWRYGLFLVEQSEPSEALEWARRSVDLLIDNTADPGVGSRESTSLAAAWLARGRVGWRAGEAASEVAKCYLASALETTRQTPRTAVKACQALARTAPLAWMSETGSFHPWKVLRRLHRLDARFQAAGESKSSPCRSRAQGLQGLALAHLGHSLTRQSESYVSEAKAALCQEGSRCEVVRLNMDLCYILLWEGWWSELARVAKEALDVASSDGGGELARCLENWHASLEKRQLEPAVWEATFQAARGLRAPLLLPEEREQESSSWLSGW